MCEGGKVCERGRGVINTFIHHGPLTCHTVCEVWGVSGATRGTNRHLLHTVQVTWTEGTDIPDEVNC